MRVLVTGGRDYADWQTFRATLIALKAEFGTMLVIHGGCPTGADRMAADWCAQRGIPCARMDAHWNALGKKAGPLRNAWMLNLLSPDLVVAFEGGRGTADMVAKAEAASIPVRRLPTTPVAPNLAQEGETL